MYPQGKEAREDLERKLLKEETFLDPTVPFWGYSRVNKKVPFLSGLFSHQTAVRQQSQKITDKTAADAGIGHSKLCTGQIMVLKSVNWQRL